jgi:DNA polymerase III subunit epsilon
MTRSVLFDTETTGLDPREGHRVIEIAALELINDLPTGRQFHHLIHPERDIPEDASRIHGMTLDHLRDKPVFRLVAAELIAFLGPDEMLVAHNAPFDFGFLNAEFNREGHPPLPLARMVDTLAMAKARFPGMPNSLDALCRRFGIDNSGRTLHGALLDAQLLAECYVELLGGRQRGLALAVQAVSVSVAVGGTAIAQRTPRAHGPSEEELAAHAAMVALLKNGPLWLDA